ncbi:MAG: chromosome partitioning protein ParA [Candidatus Latescibacterota bacterium]|nr:MAG: chromosome partitioning protein ParA [Candidatus Latescibacterota bacterium]
MEERMEPTELSNQPVLDRMSRVRRKVLVLSGKGGVGKSTVAVNLAASLMLAGRRTGLLDVDIHGPSIPTMLGIEEKQPGFENGAIVPVDADGIKVLSLGLFLRSPDDPVIWRGPMKMNAIRQFLADAAWGDLDVLVIDSPPGTGDEPLSVCQLLGSVDGAIVVTTPQKVSAVDVRKSISFCRELRVPVIGVIENMSGFACPACGTVTAVLREGGGRRIAEDMGVPFLGSIPLDPKIAESCDAGRAYIRDFADSPTARIMGDIVKSIEPAGPGAAASAAPERSVAKEEKEMKIAVPVSDGKLSMHFGHCERFAMLDVDPGKKEILGRVDLDAPPHEPGLLPRWLADKGANLIIAGGMGRRAQDLFSDSGIRVIVGAPAGSPEDVVRDYLAGTLETGGNVCDH